MRTEFTSHVTTIQNLCSKVDFFNRGTEKAEKHSGCLDALEQQVTDLQDYSRRSDLLLLELSEGAEKYDPIGFLKQSLPIWIPSLVGRDIEIEHAHRVYSTASTDHSKPQVFLFKLLHYNDRNLILDEARRHGPVKAGDGAMLSFFPDFSPATAKKRSSFSRIWKELKEEGLQTFFQYPATLKIVTKHGETKLMHSLDKAHQFLSSIPAPHSPGMDVA